MGTSQEFSPERGSNSNWATNAPIFEPDFSSHGLPGLWITRRACEPTHEITGRDCIWCYPSEDDPDGSVALALGRSYCLEGVDMDRTPFERDRIDCFRAGELALLWAASLGCAQGYSDLGHLYERDLCHGRFLEMDERGSWVCEVGEPFPRERRAHECFLAAAESGHAQATYKLGDLALVGMGCEQDESLAFELWRRAWDLLDNDAPEEWVGCCALRLGRAAEEGLGRERDFSAALMHYDSAELHLGRAVGSGLWYYEHELARAEHGKRRCEQELLGEC